MTRQKVSRVLVRSFGVFLLLCFLPWPPLAYGQADELPASYKKWLEEEVFYIITPTEREVFLDLKGNRERDLFIEAFWKHRDPTSGTEQNEFRDEHYRRLDYANRRFRGTGRPGWKTDRGKVYILLGEPTSIQEFMGQDAYYPAVQWHYQGVERYGLPSAFHLLFYRKGWVGDYILYNPGMDFPSNLLTNWQGDPTDYLSAYYELDEVEPNLAKASLTLIPGESVHQYPSMASAALIQNIDMSAIKQVEDRYARKFLEYKDVVELDYTANYIGCRAFAKIFQDYAGISYVHLCIEPDSLSMGQHESNIYTHLEINGIVTNPEGKTVFQFEKSVPLSFTVAQFETMRTRPFNFYEIFPIHPGRFQLSVLVKNTVSKEFTSFEGELSIPGEIRPNQISSLLLGFNSQRSNRPPDLPGPFLFEGLQVYSQPGNTFIPLDKMCVFFQIMSPNESLLESGSLHYTFFKGDEEVSSQVYPISRYPRSINYLEVFPLEGFRAGYYRLKVTLLDGSSREVVSSEEKFELTPLGSLPRPWVLSRSLLDAGTTETYFLLGRQLINLEDFEKARVWLEKAYRAKPERTDYAVNMAKVDFQLNRFREALEILEPELGKTPESFEVFLLAGRVQLKMQQYDRAIETADRAISLFGVQADLLNIVGECYIGLGNNADALAALKRSLELNPDQPRIQTLLDSLK